ncbi:MAG: NADH-quinone oxidoreductase subunit H [Spirochaetes bacterium]|nr:NADH-quinone oxidoreductase subunit H [Spirochaetota bacterium]
MNIDPFILDIITNPWFIAIAKYVVLFAFILVWVAYFTLAERKFAGFIQDRFGPNRAGPFGMFQPFLDGFKLFTKESFVPAEAVSKILFVAAPFVSFTVALIVWGAIPFGDAFIFGDVTVSMQLYDPNIGVIFFLAVGSLGLYGIMLSGIASNNKYSLMGSVRGAAQMISYELTLSLALIAVILMSGEATLGGIARQQSETLLAFGSVKLPGYNVIKYFPFGFFAFVFYIIAIYAENGRTPFDLPECENELVFGYHTEYSGIKFGLFYLGEYMNMITNSFLISILFFGGTHVPFFQDAVQSLPHNIAVLIGIAALIAKAGFFSFLFIWVRWTIPRFRYDTLMNLGWKRLFPFALANVFVIAVLEVALPLISAAAK